MVLLRSMQQKKISKQHATAIIGLLDDNSPTVHKAVLEELKRLGSTGIDLLEKVLEEHLAPALCVRRYLREIRGPDATERYIEFIHSLNYELETGLLMLNRTVDQDIDIAFCCSQIDEIAERCQQLILSSSTALETCKVINRVLFYEYGFRKSEKNTDPHGNLFNSVLITRRGLPLTLSALYILIAQRCRLELEPVFLKGEFIVGCFVEKIPFFINPFENGLLLSVQRLKGLLAAKNIKLTPQMLFPISLGEVLKECCLSLTAQYKAERVDKKAELFQRFVHEFDRVYQEYVDRHSG